MKPKPASTEDLSALRERFTHWRQSRAHKNELIPETLLIEVYQLTQIHQTKWVLSTLRLNSAALKRGRIAAQKLSENNKMIDTGSIDPNFLDITSHSNPLVSASIEITRQDGSRLKFIDSNQAMMKWAVEHFMRGR